MLLLATELHKRNDVIRSPTIIFWLKMELIELKHMPHGAQIVLLKALGLGVDAEGYVLKGDKRVIDKYIEKPVAMANMDILPGSKPGEVMVIDDNLLSLASYFEEFGEL